MQFGVLMNRRETPIPTLKMHVPRLTAAALGLAATALQLPLFLPLFGLRDSVEVTTAIGLALLSTYVAIAGLIFAARSRSRLGIVLSTLPLGAIAVGMLVLWAALNALGQ